MSGFINSPQNNIEGLRDLLKGYGNIDNIIKELIQNAEDADATCFEILCVQPTQNAADIHPLLTGPAICVINNGSFDKKNREAIFSIGSGTKGVDDRRIGRFGKGLKSVFALCEAFFVIGSEEYTSDWDENLWLMNPFCDWRHQDWEDHFKNENSIPVGRYIRGRLTDFGWSDGKWLAFWFPLRHPDHLRDEQGSVAAIHHWNGSNGNLPADDPAFFSQLRKSFSKMSNRILLLRNLEKLTFRGAAQSEEINLSYSPESRRALVSSDPTEEHWIEGTVLGPNQVSYIGLTGHLGSQVFEDLHRRDDWPKVIDPVGAQDSIPTKGQPHFGCILSSIEEKKPSLRINWSVYLPVTFQPDSRIFLLDPELWQESVTLTLHGSFFLDSTRTRIDGFETGFDEAIENYREDQVGANLAALVWNKHLAEDGPLANLPRVLAEFVQKKEAGAEAIRDLVRAVKGSHLWVTFGRNICKKKHYLFAAVDGVEKWILEDASQPILAVPLPNGERACSVSEFWHLSPALRQLSGRFTIIHTLGVEGGLYTAANISPLNEDQLQLLIQSVELTDTNRPIFSTWLKQLREEGKITQGIRDIIRTKPLIRISRLEGPQQSEWVDFSKCEELISSSALYSQTGELVSLAKALTNFSPWVAKEGGELSSVLEFYPPPLSRRDAAQHCLRTALSPLESDRIPLLNWLCSAVGLQDPILRQAVRLLLHGSSQHRDDTQSSLLVSSDGGIADIWTRLMRQLLGNVDQTQPWRMINKSMVSNMGDSVKAALNITTIDAQGCLRELEQFTGTLEQIKFDETLWPEADIRELIKGLCSYNQTRALPVLRRLPIHQREGAIGTTRIPIGDDSGHLQEGMLLNHPGFTDGISQDLQEVWHAFLGEVSIFKRFASDNLALAVQEELFRSNGVFHELSWPEVVAQSLNQPSNHRFAPLILKALSEKGGEAIGRLGDSLKSASLFQTASGTFFTLLQIHHIDGLESDLDDLFKDDPEVVTWGDLSDSLINHPGFRTIRGSLLLSPQRVFRRAAEKLELSAHWRVGLKLPTPPDECLKFLQTISGCADIPVAGLMDRFYANKGNVTDDQFWDIFLPVISQPWAKSEIQKRIQCLDFLRQIQDRNPHDLYLKQFVEDGIVGNLISDIQLLSQTGNWQSTKELIWPTAGPGRQHQLDEKQAKILTDDQQEEADGIIGQAGHQRLPELDRHALPDQQANARELIDYLESFAQVEDFDILAAGFISVCFNYPALRGYAEQRLQPSGKSFDAFRDQLFTHSHGGSNYDFADHHEWDKGIFIFRFQSPGELGTYKTVSGDEKQIELDQDFNNLLADSYRLSRPLGKHKGKVVRELVLRKVPNPQSLPHLTDIWRLSLKLIVEKGYGLPNTYCPDFTSLEGMLGKEFPLRRIQRTLLDGTEIRLKELRLSSKPEFQEIVKHLDQTRQARLEAEDFREGRNESKAGEYDKKEKNHRKQAETAMEGLLTADPPSHKEQMLFDSMREKLADYGYTEETVLLELFQNADDAVSELGEIALDSESRTLLLKCDPTKNFLQFVHWGRPINNTLDTTTGSSTYRSFSRDLEKMLVLNVSDKADSQQAVTGRFGLGFKSVFFFSDQPLLKSGSLNCRIRGAFYPEKLPPAELARMDGYSQALPSANTATLFHLESLRLPADSLRELLESFKRIAPYLVQCARSIHTIKIELAGQLHVADRQSLSQNRWRICNSQGGSLKLIFPHSDQPPSPAAWIFEIGRHGFKAKPEEIRPIWATVPTHEPSSIACVVNGDWMPDAGRLNIAYQSPKNEVVARQVANCLKRGLTDLIGASTADWEAFKALLQLSPELDPYRFWASFWKIVRLDKPVVGWPEVAEGADLINALLWESDFGALPPILAGRAIIPSGLEDDFRVLVKLPDVKWHLEGCLNELKELRHACLRWPEFSRTYAAGKIVDASTGQTLRQLTGGDTQIKPVKLLDVIKLFLQEDKGVSAGAASRLGTILNRKQWEKWELKNHGTELSEVRAFLAGLSFPSEAGAYVSADNLLVSHETTGLSDEIDADERRRATLAPPNRILSKNFDPEATAFFSLCRKQLKANAHVLADWARDARGDRLCAVFNYFYDGRSRGELAQGVADILGSDWLRQREPDSEFENLSQETKKEIWLLFRKVEFQTMEPIEPPPPTIDPEEALQRIADWWQRERDQRLPGFLNTTYGDLAPKNLCWPSDEDWGLDGSNLKARRDWMILFVHAALHTQGWYSPGRHREFVAFLNNNRWLDVLARSDATADDYIRILDEFLGDKPEAIVYYHAMRQFITFYASSRKLDVILEALNNLEKKDTRFPLTEAFSISLNPDFMGTGLVAPSFERGYGLGAHFVLRELYRLGHLSNNLGYEHAYVPTRSVRYLCERVFGLHGFGSMTWHDGASSMIHTQLGKLNGHVDVTFDKCFDIPLWILANDSLLQKQVLDEEILSTDEMTTFEN
jgi:hypothetical protein